MTGAEIISKAAACGCRLSVRRRDDSILSHPAGALPDELKAEIRAHKPELLVLLQRVVVPLDQLIALVERELKGARYLDTKPSGWLPDRGVDWDQVHPRVQAEFRRTITQRIGEREEKLSVKQLLDRFCWPIQARRELAAEMRPGDQIVRIGSRSIVYQRSGLCIAYWKE